MGLVDLCFTIAILAGVGLQSLYLPHLDSDCKHANDWRNATNGSNFFLLASSDFLNSSDPYFKGKDPNSVCKIFAENWRIGVATR